MVLIKITVVGRLFKVLETIFRDKQEKLNTFKK